MRKDTWYGLLLGLAFLLAACGGQRSGGGGGASPGEAFALLYEGNGTKALAVVSDSASVSVQGIKKATDSLYVAGFRQGDNQDGLQDAMVWKLDSQGQVVAKKRIAAETMPGYSPYWVRVNDRAYALALHRGYLYVAGYLAGCDDTNKDSCGGYPFVAKLNPSDLSYVNGFGGNSNPGFSQPGVAVLYQTSEYERTYAYALAVDDSGVYVGGFGGTKGFVVVLDPNTGQEQRRLVLGSTGAQAKTHVEAVRVQGGSLYVAGHTNVPFDCQGSPTGPVAQETMAFVLKLSASDLACDGGFGQGGILYIRTPGDTEILSLALSQDGTRLLAAGFGGEGISEGDVSLAVMGLARAWVLDSATGQEIASFPPFPDGYFYTQGGNCQRAQGNLLCADRARGLRLASDGNLLLVGHVKGRVQAQDRFPGTEDGLTGSNLFFARYKVDGTRLAYEEVDFGGGTELGFGVVQGPGGYYYAVGSTTGPVGSIANTNPKAIVLRFGP